MQTRTVTLEVPQREITPAAPAAEPPTVPEGPQQPHPHAWLIALGLLCGFLIDMVNANVPSVTTGYMAGTVAASPDEISGVSTAYGGAKLVMFLVTPWLLARCGRRWLMMGALLVVTVSMIGCGLSHTLFALIGWRVVQGASGAILAVAGQAVLVQIFPNRLMGLAQSVWAVGVVMAVPGIAAGGGYLAEYEHWSWAFLLPAPLGLIGAALLWKYLVGWSQDVPHQQPVHTFDWTTLVLAGIAAVSLQYVLQQGERYNWLDQPMIVFFVVLSGVAFVLMVAWLLSPRNRNPLVDLKVMRIFLVMLPVLVTVISGAASNGSSFVYPEFVAGVAGFGAADIGQSELPSIITIGLGLLLSTWAIQTRKLNPIVVTFGGFILFAVTMWRLGETTSASGYPDIGFDWALRGLALGMQSLTLITIMITSTPRKEVVYALALYNFSRQVSGSVGTAAVATALEHFNANGRLVLASHLFSGNAALSDQMTGLSGGLLTNGYDPTSGSDGALAVVNDLLQKQVAATSFDDIFLGLAVFMLTAPFGTIGLIFLIRYLAAKAHQKKQAGAAA